MIGTAVVGMILVAVVAAIIMSLVKNKKKGTSPCGCGCGTQSCPHCAAGSSCCSKQDE